MQRNSLNIILLCAICALSATLPTPSWAQQSEPQQREILLADHLARARELYSVGHYHEVGAEAARAAAVASSLRRVDPIVESEVALLGALSVAAMGDGAEQLEAFVERYPTSPFVNEALCALGGEHYEWERWEQAVEAFVLVDIGELELSEVELMAFECGHSLYHLGDYERAEEYLGRITREQPRYEHARYLLGSMAYVGGDYAEAKECFLSIAYSESYAPIVPYYLLNVEQRLGNDGYVAANADSVLESLAGSRRAEVRRVAAESNFELEEWAEAVRHIELLSAEEGAQLTRAENYIAGYSLYRLGEWERAVPYLRGACGAEDSLTRNAAYHLADCLLRGGDKRGAMQCFSMVYGGGDDAAMREDAHYNYCKLQVELGGSNFNEEIRTLRGYLQTYPTSVHRTEIEGYLISACYAANDLKGAYGVLEEFESSGGRVKEAMQRVAYYYAAECYSRGELEEAEEYCGYALDHKEYNDEVAALTIYLFGEIDYSLGKWHQSAAMYDQYVAMDMTHRDEYPFAFYNMGYANFNGGRYRAAYDDLRDFVEIRREKDHYYADAYNRMGDAKAASREYGEAARLYAVSAATDTDESYYGAYRKAMMEGMSGNIAARVEDLEAIVAKGRGNYATRAHYELGNTLLGAGNYRRSAEVLREYVERYPSSRDYISALADLGLALRNTGDNDAALAAYKKIVATTRGSLAAHNALGEIRNIYIERNDVDGFFAYADGVGLSGNLGGTQRDSLAFVAAQRLYIGGDKGGASEAFDKYLAENPEGLYSAAALYYAADCKASLGDSLAARESLTRLTAMYYNNYTQRGYERLAQLAAAGADWGAAMAAYRSLAEMEGSAESAREVLGKYLSTAIATSDAPTIITAADYTVAHKDASEELIRKARFAKAGALEATGKRNPAVAIYSSLSQDVSNAEGAESAYKIIETAFRFGSFEKAEDLVYEFAEKNTPHAYWLARSFLLLGDVYVSRGDLFQARATYQSVVDGYGNESDGILDVAREKVAQLGETTNEAQ